MSRENSNTKNPNLDSQNENLANANNDDKNQPEETLEYEPFSDEIDKKEGQSSCNTGPNEDKVRIQILEEQLERTKEQMIRALADAENSRKRAIKEREDASKFAVSSFARDLINVADNLRRALESVPEEILNETPQIKNLTDGIEATERELLRSFEKNGITRTNPLNEIFNPNFHEVMFETPMPDKESGVIIQVIEPGYIINGRILRPARVGVAKNDSNQCATKDESTHTIDTKV